MTNYKDGAKSDINMGEVITTERNGWDGGKRLLETGSFVLHAAFI
jgi:hypothetical protein